MTSLIMPSPQRVVCHQKALAFGGARWLPNGSTLNNVSVAIFHGDILKILALDRETTQSLSSLSAAQISGLTKRPLR
jgi:hypothetical protein